jgi:hypothetical protein
MKMELSRAEGAFDYTDRGDARLFGELPGRVLVTFEQGIEDKLKRRANEKTLNFAVLGNMEPGGLQIVDKSSGSYEWPLDALQSAYEGSIPSLMAH